MLDKCYKCMQKDYFRHNSTSLYASTTRVNCVLYIIFTSILLQHYFALKHQVCDLKVRGQHIQLNLEIWTDMSRAHLYSTEFMVVNSAKP